MRGADDRLRTRMLSRPEVRREYDKLEEEFALFDEFLKARRESGMSQADVARKIGTTQSAIARLESPAGKHSPSLATLRRYAEAMGYRVEIRLVKKEEAGQRGSQAKSGKRARSRRRVSARQLIVKD